MFSDIIKNNVKTGYKITESDIKSLNPLVLAYIGDAVYEVFIRSHVIASEPRKSVHELHMMSTGYVKAHAQAEIVRRISPLLREEELAIIRRGRNSKSGYVPKNADIIEYRIATGFEALVGYLYLTDDDERLLKILEYAILGQE